MNLKKYIRSVKDYPKKGILFRDITTLIKDPLAFKYSIDKIIEISKKLKPHGAYHLMKFYQLIMEVRQFVLSLGMQEDTKLAQLILILEQT